MKQLTENVAQKAPSHKQKRGSQKSSTQKNKRGKQSRQAKRKRRKSKRPNNNVFAGKQFHTLGTFIHFCHKYLQGFVDKHWGKKRRQSKYPHLSCWITCLLRCLLGLAHLSDIVDRLQCNPHLSKILGCRQVFQNSKPLAEFLLKLSTKVMDEVFNVNDRQKRSYSGTAKLIRLLARRA